MKPPKLGTVWIARAQLFNKDMELLGTCIDTPNGIAKALMECEDSHRVKDSAGVLHSREEYEGRMKSWNIAQSFLVLVDGDQG